MAATTSVPAREVRHTPAQLAALAERRRHRIIGIIMVMLGFAGFALFANTADPTAVSTFGLNTGRTAIVRLGDLVLPTQATIIALSSLCLFVGGYQIIRGFGKATNALFGLIILFFIASFLVWATGDKSINLAAMINSTLLRAVPLTLGALSGVVSERSGVVNIAIEGMMLSGALAATMIASAANSLWAGVVGAVLIGVLLALFHAVLSIRYKVDQIISGTVINIFSVGITSFISAKFLSEFPQLNNPGIFKSEPIPVLSAIPLIGPIFFDNNFFAYAMFILLIVIHIALFSTRWGLRTRAVGEHPKAADTLGINVFRTRYTAVLLSGALAGFAGAYFTLGSVGRFDEGMTAGRGFIALAAMIFGNWTPFGAFGAALIFGFADSLQSRLAILSVPIPSQFLLMAPYIATMIALAGLIGRTTPPAADGKPYEKQ